MEPDHIPPQGLEAREPTHPAKHLAYTRTQIWLRFGCGCAIGLLFMEILLHPFSGKTESRAGAEVRNYREGLAQAHFASDGRRLTGNPQIAGAPNVLIAGDSHVEAFQVWDKQTMGSVLERRLRAAGKPWNVVQYGWSGADGPDYVYAAPLLEKEFPSKEIFLIMNAGDFGSTTTEAARLVERNGKVVAEPSGPRSVRGRTPSYGGYWARKLKESGLFYAAALRFNLDLLPQLSDRKAGAQAEDSVVKSSSQETLDLIMRGLREAYGSKLCVLYTPEQPFSAQAPPEAQESSLLAECKTLELDCRSLRGRMVNDLVANHRLDRGFSDTAPGIGHFNAHGHEQVADELYDWLNALP